MQVAPLSSLGNSKDSRLRYHENQMSSPSVSVDGKEKGVERFKGGIGFSEDSLGLPERGPRCGLAGEFRGIQGQTTN